eukprot:871471-Pleurochrysis_carterae.AAC.1
MDDKNPKLACRRALKAASRIAKSFEVHPICHPIAAATQRQHAHMRPQVPQMATTSKEGSDHKDTFPEVLDSKRTFLVLKRFR